MVYRIFEGQGGGPQILRSWGNNFWLNYNQLERRPLTSAWTFRVVELKVECLGCTNSTVKRRETTHCAPVRSLTAPEVIPVKKLMQCLGFEGQLNRKNHDNPQSEVTQTTKLIVWYDFVVLWYPSLTSLAACQSRDIANKHYRYRGINEITMIYICILHTAIIISPTKTWPGSGVQGWRNSWFIGRWWKGTCCRSRCRGFGFSNTRIKPPGEQNLLTQNLGVSGQFRGIHTIFFGKLLSLAKNKVALKPIRYSVCCFTSILSSLACAEGRNVTCHWHQGSGLGRDIAGGCNCSTPPISVLSCARSTLLKPKVVSLWCRINGSAGTPSGDTKKMGGEESWWKLGV